MRIPSTRLGEGTISNSSIGAARRIFTLRQNSVGAGTRTFTATQGQTFMDTIEGIFLQNIPSVAGAVASATNGSLHWVPSLTAALTVASGTILIKEASKTLNKATKVHQLYIGTPDPRRMLA